jgi:phage gpG-like protein
MARAEYNNAGKVLEKRILDRLDKFQPKDPKIREVMTRIGILIERETKKNITRPRDPKNLVDTGALLNSIKFKVTQRGYVTTLKVGSYSIPYAAIHEFGLKKNVTVKAHKREVATSFGGVISNVSAHTRMVNIRARPYLRPAVKSVRKEIFQILGSLL